jgi:hypothetical protein
MSALQRTVLLSTLLLLAAGSAAAQIGPGPFVAFPTLNTTDGRMLAFGCPGTATFEQGVTIGLATPAGEATFTVNIFDGETGKPDGGGKPHWDFGSRQLVYRLYADPLRQGNTAPADLIGAWTGNDPNPTSGPLWTASAAAMPDNDWWGVTVSTSAEAEGPSGNFFYNLVIESDGVCGAGEVLASNIKVAATSPMAFIIPRFGLEAALRQVHDGSIIYPGGFPPPGNDFVNAPTTYDGTFTFGFVLPGAQPDLRLFNGDFDHGTNSLVGNPSGIVLSPCFDLDDPDTPANYAGFPFATAGALPEGALLPGIPPDDNHFDLYRRGELGDPGRVGCVRYEVIDPNGVVYRDDNPSGNLEWEQFRIASQSADDPNDADYVVNEPALPAGAWTVKIYGLDMSNLNFWFAHTCSTTEDGIAACPPPAAPGTGTPGYWKNHSEAWPVETITIGGVVYTKAQAIALMQKATKGDKTYNMFEQLVAAKLNVLAGNEASCINGTIAAADLWMATYGPVGSNVKASSAAWAVGGPLATTLDRYNNGQLCAPSRG